MSENAMPAAVEKESPEAPEALAERLGQTVERLRRAYNLSLGSLSEQSGVAKSIISQIERNETNPTLSTLLKLSRALNTSVEDLLAGSREQSAFIEHQGVTATPVLFSQDGLCRLRIIGWLKTVELVQWYDFTAEPGGILESEGHPAGSIENLSVLAGTVLVRSGDTELRLEAGETGRYRADRPHSVENIGQIPAHATMVNLLPPVAGIADAARSV